MVRRVEHFVVEEYRHGHLSGQAREQLERAVERLRDAARRHGGQPGAESADSDTDAGQGRP